MTLKERLQAAVDSVKPPLKFARLPSATVAEVEQQYRAFPPSHGRRQLWEREASIAQNILYRDVSVDYVELTIMDLEASHG